MRCHRRQLWRMKEFRKADVFKDNLLLVSLTRHSPWSQYRLGADNWGETLQRWRSHWKTATRA